MEDKKFSYGHGGDVYSEGLLKGKKFIDFSSNINPLGVPDSFKNNMNEALESVVRYPDVQYRKVINSINEYLEKDYSQNNLNILVGNGAAEIIDIVISLFKKILIIVPSFSEYESSARKWGLEIVYSTLTENMDYDYEDMERKITKVDAIFLGNPNNPSGNIINKQAFLKIIKLCEENNKAIIVDEAFIEFTGDKSESFIEEANKYKSLFVIRALTKYFALPGVRFGYGVTSNKVIAKKFKNKQNPWSVNCFAETAVKYALKDYDYMEASEKWIKHQRKYMLSELKKIDCIDRVFDTKANFILCRLKNITGEELYRKCFNNGVLIRRVANYRALNDNYIRFAIKDYEANNRLLEVLKG